MSSPSLSTASRSVSPYSPTHSIVTPTTDISLSPSNSSSSSSSASSSSSSTTESKELHEAKDTSIYQTYTCGECGSDVKLKKDDQVRCHECFCRIVYKKRTTKPCQYLAR
eukprot:TRINITY_DN7624_c0_g1_i1.p2 TRINITY_DN7624_c0_g1~~TRINITY_DN7624_c0_g1_i1.p2  ORF type:complete len:110 (+),score=39.03 TRINITY_DN7624_c0_g1_i1:114-443(+)